MNKPKVCSSCVMYPKVASDAPEAARAGTGTLGRQGGAMRVRSIEEIERAFREMGLTETTWGRVQTPEIEVVPDISPAEQVFIRIETTSTPLAGNIG